MLLLHAFPFSRHTELDHFQQNVLCKALFTCEANEMRSNSRLEMVYGNNDADDQA